MGEQGVAMFGMPTGRASREVRLVAHIHQAQVTLLETTGTQMVSEAGEHTCTRVSEISPIVHP